MFRNAWCASVGTELSNALAAWTYDKTETPLEDRARMLGLSMNQNCTPPGGRKGQEGQKERAPGVMLLRRCPRVELLLESKPAERRMAAEGLCLMSYLQEF